MTKLLNKFYRVDKAEKARGPFEKVEEMNIFDSDCFVSDAIKEILENVMGVWKADACTVAALSRAYSVWKGEKTGGVASLEKGGYAVELFVENPQKFMAPLDTNKPEENSDCFVIDSSGNVFGNMFVANKPVPYVLNTNRGDKANGRTKRDLRAAVALINLLAGKDEYECGFETVSAGFYQIFTNLDNLNPGSEEFSQHVAALCEILFFIEENEVSPFINVKTETLPPISSFGPYTSEAKKGVFGHILMDRTSAGTAINGITAEQFIDKQLGKYDINPNRIRTPEEKEAINSLLEELKGQHVDRDAEYIAKVITGSRKTPSPISNILFRGRAGDGKSNAVAQAAVLLNLPRVVQTFSPTDEKDSLTMEFVPRTKKPSMDEIKLVLDKYPSVAQMDIDPEGSFQKIAGYYKSNVTEQDCLLAMMADMAYNSDFFKSMFDSVESPIADAARNGKVCELAEANIVQNPGVLASLNSLFDRTRMLRLSNGEVIRRHPDSVYIITMNVGYEGTRQLNEAIRSRFGFFVNKKAPSREEIAHIVKWNSGLDDQKTIFKMIQAMENMQQSLLEETGTDMGFGLRQLINWAVSAKVTDDIYTSGLATMVGFVDDEEIQAILRHSLDNVVINPAEYSL